MFLRKACLLSTVSIVPWLLMASGGIAHMNSVSLFLLGLSVSISVFGYVFFLSYLSEKPEVPKKDLINKKYIYIFLPLLSILLYKNFQILYDAGFNPQFARNLSFSKVGGVWGDKYINMFFGNIIVPFFILYLISARHISKLDILALFIYVVAEMLVGSRFVLYYVALILILRSLVSDGYLYSLPRMILIVLILFLLAIGMGFVRSLMSYGIEAEEAILASFRSFYEYHSIQFGVYGFYERHTVYLGPFIGIVSPFYTLFGGGSPESNAATFLNDVTFQDKFNAFGTSAFFFNFAGYFGFILFIAAFILITLVVYICISCKYRVFYVRYVVFSLYFSAFQPYAFTFQWWSIIVYFLLLSLIHQSLAQVRHGLPLFQELNIISYCMNPKAKISTEALP